ncbi:hypothetical protein DENSPDRAFT_654147 [Dentipellis sp. KUC8613]|nr:hypothetical protein DENSPDRAFT_654147 [Dentipellis sp. KUC8613]
MILLSSSLITALAAILTDFVYQLHEPDCFNTINTILFASGLCIHAVAYAFQLLTPHTSISPHLPHSYNALAHIALLFVRAFVDYFALFIIYYYDAALERVLAISVLPAVLVVSASANDISMEFGMGCVVVVWATASYAAGQLGRSHDEIQSPKITEPNPKHRVIGTIVFSALLIGSVYSTVNSRHAPAPASAVDRPPTCQRRPLPMQPLQPAEERTYHHFDDVLLIVFFSHARYNVNLDYYRTVYSEFFPNMVFIGPASRENAGFNHSYDVVVDSYKADEDLRDPGYYKMAGRMAHHMLYTGLKEFPCYKGYLWAPFDTLLNVPRLEQFDQNLFWYHSPFAEYVYNPALGFGNKDPEHHPPAAQISPDPALNLTENWRGWGRDWWWGDPHVGLGECMPAFLRVPLALRQRLAEYTEGKTRFIGGSADTMYIPGRHRETFMETLGIFLETDCFLEIATPTVLHLVVPPGEKILFVDHWWIWEPPLNATFVRNKWNEGFEVDTFHTFHWGDRDEAGVWRGNHENIADVRELLRESALRQFTNLPASVP